MNRAIGTCGACGGRVSVPTVWMGTVPPIPQCESCHRHVRQPHGPKLDMEDGPPKDLTFNRSPR